MTLFQAIGLVFALVALFGYLKARRLRLPEPIGITAVGLGISLVVAITGIVHPAIAGWAKTAIAQLDFTEGISVALALSLPNLQGREAILAGTFGVVLFSILVQALTMRPLLRKLMPRNRNGG